MLVQPARWERKRFCSRSCLGTETAVRLNATRKPATSNSSWFTKGHRAGAKLKQWQTFECDNCKVEFERVPYRAMRQDAGKRKFCTKFCRDDFRKSKAAGSNAPDWVGGPKTYRGRSWKKARLLIVKKQRGKCAHCPKKLGKSLPVHHLKPFRLFDDEQEANSPYNLIGLCQSCHMKCEFRKAQDRESLQLSCV